MAVQDSRMPAYGMHSCELRSSETVRRRGAEARGKEYESIHVGMDDTEQYVRLSQALWSIRRQVDGALYLSGQAQQQKVERSLTIPLSQDLNLVLAFILLNDLRFIL